MSDTWSWFQQTASGMDVPVSDAQLEAFRRYHELLVEANKTTNLTRIVDERDAVLKHYLDSLLFLAQVPAELHEKPLKLVDVGAGAGIPGIPLLIMRPHWQGLLVDSVGKKVHFMNEAMAALGLAGSRAVHGRAEDLAREPGLRDGHDLGVARAVAALPELLELLLPFIKPGGILVVSKGAKGAEELASAGPALKALHGRLRSQACLALPEDAGERNLYVIDKHDRTPAGYPRKAGIPHSKPIC
jgi:16S rRNA (guanine527-N7)-methyltransferase